MIKNICKITAIKCKVCNELKGWARVGWSNGKKYVAKENKSRDGKLQAASELKSWNRDVRRHMEKEGGRL